ncbi:hypothetical protein M514_07315 [Trichuris suis]|uniref:Uncharacterized protein n=1 Tax=Trichuris suis TaxID=68888 RepID=A0A085M3J2_9BILA|nr:hypothetical protein M513_07315 [Trichuris suis]KFD59908.1 hypothetical protein M514_07315 [Trichuris suis]
MVKVVKSFSRQQRAPTKLAINNVGRRIWAKIAFLDKKGAFCGEQTLERSTDVDDKPKTTAKCVRRFDGAAANKETTTRNESA